MSEGAPPAPVTVVVIAGGRAQRLGGTPKGLLRVGSTTLIERTLEVAPEGPRWINANRPEPYAFLHHPIVGDIEPGRGAPGGVLTALAVSATDWVLALACDMPRLSRGALEALLARRSPDVDVVCFERDGDLEPLAALYHRRLLPRWTAALRSNPSLRGLIRAARLLPLTPGDASELDSVNTPHDAARLGVRRP